MILAVVLAALAGAALMVGYAASPPVSRAEQRIRLAALAFGGLLLTLASILALAVG